MRVRVLGSAAGGGFPQWNCGCLHCRKARAGSLACRTRTQSSIAVSTDGTAWYLFNASPDLRSHIEACPSLWPKDDTRQTPIQSIILSDAEIDSTLGLLSLREERTLRVYATAWVHTALSTWNPLLRTLSAYCHVEWQPVKLLERFPLINSDGSASGLCCQAFPTGSIKLPAFAREEAPSREAVVGYRITEDSTGHATVYLPSVQHLHAEVMSQLQGCQCLLIDGTCWSNDELPRLGISTKTANAMGHVPISGEHGSLKALTSLPCDRIIYTHLNNTNPLLIENSPQRKAVESHGIEVAFDGMEMEI